MNRDVVEFRKLFETKCELQAECLLAGRVTMTERAQFREMFKKIAESGSPDQRGLLLDLQSRYVGLPQDIEILPPECRKRDPFMDGVPDLRPKNSANHTHLEDRNGSPRVPDRYNKNRRRAMR